MTLSVYHVSGQTSAIAGNLSVPFKIGVCADGKTEAARIVRARVFADGYDNFTHHKTERICAAGPWEPGTTVWY